MFSLWKHDENGSLVPDIEELKLITEFRNLWRCKIGTTGDINGVGKLANTEYLRYIFFMDDFRSPWIGYPEKERHIKALKETVFFKNCELHNISMEDCHRDFKADKMLTAARKRYRWLQETAEVRILVGLKRGLHNIRVIIDFCNKNIDRVMNEEEPTIEQIALALKAAEDIMTLSDKVPKALDNIQSYEKKVMQQAKMEKYAKGKIKIGNRADPVLDAVKLD